MRTIIWSQLWHIKVIISLSVLVFYIIILAFTSYRIIMNTRDASKAIAYLLLIYIFPLIGLIVYQMLGINNKKHPFHTHKLETKKKLSYAKKIQESNYHQYPVLDKHKNLIDYLSYKIESPLLPAYETEVLINGENKYPKLFESLDNAKYSIHILYYIFEDDEIWKQIENIIIQKAKQGIKVRFIFDDFWSNGLHKEMVKRLHKAGVEIYPFYPFKRGHNLVRLNNRNHRKIIVIDGKEWYVWWINISKSYDNRIQDNTMYWRDTHLRIIGPAVNHLQYIFLYDWKYCCDQDIENDASLFPVREHREDKNSSNIPMQIVTSGPGSKFPTILNSIIQAINTAQEEINITTPYFVPDTSLLTALTIAAHRGIKIKIMIPFQWDSRILTMANASYFQDLIESWIEIYLYKKWFVHAKTITIDKWLSIIGTANLDMRSFALNFEINAVVYDYNTTSLLNKQFTKDLIDSHFVTYDELIALPKWKIIVQHIIRLASPVL